MANETGELREFRAEVDVSVRASSLEEAENLIEVARAVMCQHGVQASVAAVVEHHDRTPDDALREWTERP